MLKDSLGTPYKIINNFSRNFKTSAQNNNKMMSTYSFFDEKIHKIELLSTFGFISCSYPRRKKKTFFLNIQCKINCISMY